MSKGPCEIYLTEEMVLNPSALPEYMRGARKFRIEYREPETGFSNFEGNIWLSNTHDIFDITDAIEELLRRSFNALPPLECPV